MAANKPKTNNAGDVTKVSAMDVCQTPPHAIEPLLKYIPQDWIIWESASGPEELLVKAFLSHGYQVVSSDLMHGEIYNRFSYKPKFYNIEVTNVPFSIKYDWIAQAFADGKPFAVLVPYETTFAADFMTLAEKYHLQPWPIEVLSPERRINFKMPNMGWGIEVWDEKKGKMVKKGDSAQMPTMWLTWGLNVWKHQTEAFVTYRVPMRSVKYNDDNTEKESHAKRKKSKR